jgi:hypothetical protein
LLAHCFSAVGQHGQAENVPVTSGICCAVDYCAFASAFGGWQLPRAPASLTRTHNSIIWTGTANKCTEQGWAYIHTFVAITICFIIIIIIIIIIIKLPN